MTREDIIHMAAKAGVSPVNDQQIKFEGPMWLCLERFAALVAAAEREACAKACERLEKSFAILGEEFEYAPRIPTAEDFAEYIRARGDI